MAPNPILIFMNQFCTSPDCLPTLQTTRLPSSFNHVQSFASRSIERNLSRSSAEPSSSSIWIEVISVPSVSDLHTNQLPNSNLLAAEKALACLHSKPFPGLNPPANIVLSPYPPTDPPTPLPPASATPRLVKFLPTYYTDFQLYDIFRPYGALAAVKTRVSFAQETAMIEFWREDDARKAEDGMYCAQIDGHNIAIQSYQPRRASGSMSDFGLGASPFVTSGYPYPVNQVFSFPQACSPESHGTRQVFTSASNLSRRTAKFRSRSWSTSPTCALEWSWLNQSQRADRPL